MEAFVDEFAPTGASGILDVGGTETNWRFVDVPSRIVLLNLTVPEPGDARPSNIEWVAGNGCDLHYDDDEFDICFSNSTIEHLHTYENQKRFAAEVRRVAPSYYVQTPAKSFPFEPHWLGFFVHWLPRRWQPRVARWGTLYGLAFKPTASEVGALIDEYRLLSYREMRSSSPTGRSGGSGSC